MPEFARATKSLAELIPDRGAGSTAPEFFRCPQFLESEGVTHTLRITSALGQVAIPLICRGIPNSPLIDAVSPYGYPGGSVSGVAHEVGAVDLSDTGLVSVFIRDRVAFPTLPYGRRRSQLFLYDPALPRRVRASIQHDVKKNEDARYKIETLVRADVTQAMQVEFLSCYHQTMRRVDAAGGYFYSLDYLRRCLTFEASWLVVAWDVEGNFASGLILVLSDGMLHYYLSATASKHLSHSPSKNCLISAMELADDLAVPLNFGGGVKPGDGLERFKRGFSNRTEHFITHELICNPSSYAALGGSPGTFFPAYRAQGLCHG